MNANRELPSEVGSIACWTAGRVDRSLVSNALNETGHGDHLPALSPVDNFKYCLERAGALRYKNDRQSCEVKRKWRGWNAPDPMPFEVWINRTHPDRDNEMELAVYAQLTGDGVWSIARNMDEAHKCNFIDMSKDIMEYHNTEDYTAARFANTFSGMWSSISRELSGGQVSKMFKNILGGPLDGLPIKNGGTVYWINTESAKVWNDLQKSFWREAPTIRVQSWSASPTPDTFKSLLAVLEDQLEDKIEKLEELTRNNSESDSDLKKRENIAKGVRSEIAKFDYLLGSDLDGLRDRLKNAERAAVQAEASASSVSDDIELFNDLPF